ncbi:MAG: histidine ammonia-lyase [Kosmotogaceae bacterium]
MVIIDGHSLTLKEVYNVAFKNERVDIANETLSILKKTRERLEKDIENKTIYGVNTGFGILANKKVEKKEIELLQENIVKSHAAGVGNPLKVEYVRAVMLIRANSLCKGYSGIRPIIVKRLVEYINRGICPYVPSQGSVGASGDLSPLSHIALSLIGEGQVFYNGKLIDSKKSLRMNNLEPLTLKAKEGLSLVNGTAFMAGIGACVTYAAYNLFFEAIKVAAISVDALEGSTSPFDKRVHDVRSHTGQRIVAGELRKALENSEIRRSHLDCDRVQDPYTLRAIPQVYGAFYDTLMHVYKTLEIEVNSATDNPLIFKNGDVISCGNFHGEPIALVFDFLSIALTDMGNMIERRIDRLVNPKLNDFPAFLTKGSEGLNSGYMIWQYTAAALASENKTLAHPASADSIPTSGFQEDHVSMGAWGARKLDKIFENWEKLIAIELMLSYRAIQFRIPMKSGSIINEITNELSNILPEDTGDRCYGKDFEIVLEFLLKKADL